MASVQLGPVTAVLGQSVLLGVLALRVPMSATGWVVGLTCGAGTAVCLALALARRGQVRLGPADWVTLTRMLLVGCVAALVADDPQHPPGVIVWIAAMALALDGVDGQVARRTGTASDLGARFDMEVDAFLILVLSIPAALDHGWWVLTIGLARYAFVAASWFATWLRRPLPYRHWRKVVAAIQGVALTVALSDVIADWVSTILLAAALALLAESFGRDVHWLWRRRNEADLVTAGSPTSMASPAARPAG